MKLTTLTQNYHLHDIITTPDGPAQITNINGTTITCQFQNGTTTNYQTKELGKKIHTKTQKLLHN